MTILARGLASESISFPSSPFVSLLLGQSHMRLIGCLRSLLMQFLIVLDKLHVELPPLKDIQDAIDLVAIVG